MDESRKIKINPTRKACNEYDIFTFSNNRLAHCKDHFAFVITVEYSATFEMERWNNICQRESIRNVRLFT